MRYRDDSRKEYPIRRTLFGRAKLLEKDKAFPWALVSTFLSILALSVSCYSFYYSNIRIMHDVRAAVADFRCEEKTTSVSVIFINLGNKEEVIYDLSLSLGEVGAFEDWALFAPLEEDSWSHPFQVDMGKFHATEKPAYFVTSHIAPLVIRPGETKVTMVEVTSAFDERPEIVRAILYVNPISSGYVNGQVLYTAEVYSNLNGDGKIKCKNTTIPEQNPQDVDAAYKRLMIN